MLTLFGLVLSVGIVVDDAIVVVENVERKLKEGLSPVRGGARLHGRGGHRGRRHRPGAVRRVRPDRVPRRHHRPVLPPVRHHHRHRHRHLAVPVAHSRARRSPPCCSSRTARTGAALSSWRRCALFFRLFDAGFDAIARGYAGLVRRLAAVWLPVLVCYALVLGFGIWFVQQLPTGFIPNLDRAILVISLQLPPGASLQRTDAVVRKATDILLAEPGVRLLQRLHRAQRRHLLGRHQRRPAVHRARRFRGPAPASGLTVDKIAQSLSGQAWPRRSRRRRRWCSSRRRCAAWARRPASPCGCRTPLGLPAAELARITQEFVAEANRTPGIANAFTTFAAATPQVFVDVDRDKAQMLQGAGHQHLRGHARVHGLGLRQRLQHVRPHLPRHRPGRRRLPARPGERLQDPCAQLRRARWCRWAAS